MIYVKLLFLLFVLIIRMTSIENKKEEQFARIIGGYRLEDSSAAKHIVSLRYGDDHGFYGSNHLCGGSILTDRIILTAAHCIINVYNNKFKNIGKLSVVVGNKNRLRHSKTEQSFKVRKIIPFPMFDRETAYGDIALLYLKGHITEDGVHIQRVNLTSEEPKEGQHCTFLGWGDVIPNGPAADELVFMNVTLLPVLHCALFSHMVKGIICAGIAFGPQKIAASGDSGGPLICNGTIVGVASYVVAIRTYFSAVYHYRDWIEANSKNKSLRIYRNSCRVFTILLLCNFVCGADTQRIM